MLNFVKSLYNTQNKSKYRKSSTLSMYEASTITEGYKEKIWDISKLIIVR